MIYKLSLMQYAARYLIVNSVYFPASGSRSKHQSMTLLKFIGDGHCMDSPNRSIIYTYYPVTTWLLRLDSTASG